ncbi:hypothetical protein ERN12_10145 [Rhodobacteraceae bacterium]|nr:hypothetical protein ERN12_10145 [Paracoccaceae bacterium]
MVRVLVHAGFHKTGTTSLQDYLKDNHDLLRPYMRFYGKLDFFDAGAAARRFGQAPFFWRKLAFRLKFRRFLNRIPSDPVIVLSRETFAGAMPGHRDWRGRRVQRYAPTAIALAHVIESELKNRFGPETSVEFLYTTRDPQSWLRSVWGHLLRSIHLQDDMATYCATHAGTVDLDEEVAQIRRALAPLPVYSAALEDLSTDPAGPAAAVLDVLGVPDGLRAKLPPAGLRNTAQRTQLQSAFLTLNRSGKSKAELKRIKDDMLKGKI